MEEPAVKKVGLVKNKDKTRAVTVEEEPNNMGTSNSKNQAASKNEYTVDQLAATFSTEDWESLYAFVEEIDSCDKKDGSYDRAWQNWAEDRDNQTADQWRQYYEKVVRPQWLRDPVSKRQQIKKKVEERVQDSSSSPSKSQSWSQTQDKAVAASQSKEADPVASPKPTLPNILPSDSSTAQQATPQYLRDGYESALKRIRGQTDDVAEPAEQARPPKIQKRISLSPTLVEPEEPVQVIGTQEQPLEVLSAISSQQAIDDEDEAESHASEDDLPGIAPLPRPSIIDLGDEDDDDDDDESVASSTDITHFAPLPKPPRIPEDEDDEDELPSNTPTPRATKVANFDTQAILSPSQHPTRISKLPLPRLDSSPPHHPESDASTTQSLQEFSSYLKETEQYDQTQTQQPLTRLPRPASPTPSATSEVSSSGSGDPDEPLAADEMEDFFTAQHAEGFSDEYITKALKRTRFRPLLAEKVLDAWKHGKHLPNERGVWTIEEDEEVESGDGAALARLQRKHTLDGWGGITERLNFLRAWERR